MMDEGPPLLTVRRRLTAEQAETRTRILAAAEEQLRRVGHRDLAMAEVARVAGSSRATLYRLFSSREHLVAEVTFAWGRAFAVDLAAGLGAASERSPRSAGRAERAGALLVSVLEEGGREPRLLAAALASLTSRDPSSRFTMEGAGALLGVILGEGDASLLKPQEALVLGRFLFAQLSLLAAEQVGTAEAREQLLEAVDWTLR